MSRRLAGEGAAPATRSRLADEGGFTLVELLAAMTILIVVLFATLVVLDRFSVLGSRTEERGESHDSARRAVDGAVRQLRQAAGADGALALERAEAFDLVAFSTVPPGVARGANAAGRQRLRLCLDAGGRLLRQVHRWTSAETPPLPAGECGASGWGPASVVGDHLVNRGAGGDRALFAYAPSATEPASVSLTVHVDARPGRGAPEATLTSAVQLRNQNRRPVATFTAAAVGDRHVVLNGSGSEDPDGDPLTYTWLVDGGEVTSRGALHDYTAPASGPREFRLRVSDPSGASATSAAVTVEVP